ncbi:MAG: N-acetylmuramoyl-L-alanine amidase [Clostridia bacterium]|nr:N-acetylmuramoyl-L-alanine amidase [Clostridia bacterium]
MHLYECLMTHSTWYKGTTGGHKPVGILWHDTGAGNPDIKRYVQPYEGDANYDEMMKLLGKNEYGNDWNHNYRDAGVHAFIGKLADGSVATVQVGKYDMYPWGCGSGSVGSCNGYLFDKSKNVVWQGKHWIQFEICDDFYESRVYFEKVYRKAVEFTAMLCKLYGLDPNGTVSFGGKTVPVITCHYDSHKLKLGSNHGDVLKWFKKYGKTMNDVRRDVAVILYGKIPEPGDVVEIIGDTYYSGKTVPAWVKALHWIVKKVNGDRVVVDMSEDGKHSICSPFNVSSLKVIANPQPWVPKIGDEVYYNGSVHYTNPNAIIPKLCKSGLATITNISGLGKSKHPYQLRYVPNKGATVYGWVNDGTFTKK